MEREREREKTKKMKKLLNRKIFQIISQGRVSVSDFQEYSVLWDRLKAKFIQGCFEFITFHYSNCCILRVLKDDAE